MSWPGDGGGGVYAGGGGVKQRFFVCIGGGVVGYMLAEVVLSSDTLYVFFKRRWRKSKFLRHLVSAIHTGTDICKKG